MTGSRDLGALLIVLGLVYALFYIWWLRRSSRRPSAAGMLSVIDATEPSGQIAHTTEADTAELPAALTPAWAEGTSTGASVQDSPVETETRPEIGAAIQDSPMQTEIAAQSQAEAAMPQDGHR